MPDRGDPAPRTFSHTFLLTATRAVTVHSSLLQSETDVAFAAGDSIALTCDMSLPQEIESLLAHGFVLRDPTTHRLTTLRARLGVAGRALKAAWRALALGLLVEQVG